jgi:fibronectin-binding autotransporter adhesin
MIGTKVRCKRVCRTILAGMGLLASVLASQGRAATELFDVNGATSGFGITTGSTYSWDDPNWTLSATGVTATTAWPQGNFPKFSPTGTPTYTVTVSNDEQIAGMFASTAQNLTVNAVGSGDLNIVTGLQGVLGASGATLTINAPITGVGSIQLNNGGTIALNGINTYTGGTSLAPPASLIKFNNGSSFGTGTITNNQTSATGFAALLGTGGATITLPNNFAQGTVSGGGINFAADASTPVISTGTWSLGASNLNLRNNGVSTSPVTLTGIISGTAGVLVSGANGGSIIFSGPNTYTGTTTIGSGTTVITLKLGAANTIATSSSIIMAGGTLNPDGFNQTMSSTTLGMTAGSKIDYGSVTEEMDFANSSALTWSGILNFVNFDTTVDKIRVGTDATGLTSAQLASIELNGGGLGLATIDANGFVSVPEPTSAIVLLGASLLMVRRRRSC